MWLRSLLVAMFSFAVLPVPRRLGKEGMHACAGLEAGRNHPRNALARRVALACALGVVVAGASAGGARAETVTTVIPVGNNAQGLAYDSGKGEVFVANAGDGTVSVISDASNSVVATIPVSGAYGPAGVAYDAGKGEVFVTDGRAGTVSVISDATNTVVASVPVGGNPGGIAYDAARGEVFVADGGNTLSAISDATNTVVATVTVGSGATSLAYDSGRGEIFSANTDGTVSVISDSSNTVVATIAAVGYGAAVYDPATGEVFVANGWPGSITAPGTVSVISDATNTVVATVAVGNTAQGAAYDSRTGEVFVGNHYSNSVSAIADATNTVVATVGGVGGPTGVAYDASRREIFVGDSNFNSVTVIADGAPLNADAVGGVHDEVRAVSGQPIQVDTLASGTTLSANLDWFAGFGPLGQPAGTTFSDPKVSIDSGYPSSEFVFCDGSGATGAFPIVISNPGGGGAGTEICTPIPASMQTGCEITRSISPLDVPVTGGQQTFTITVRCTDPAVDEISPDVGMALDGATLVSFTTPDLNQGETLNGPMLDGKNNGVHFDLMHIVTGQAYTFEFVYQVPNPFRIPFADKPGMGLDDYTPMAGSCFECGPQSSITIADPTLDGPGPGKGQVTFSDSEPHVWDLFHDRDRGYGLSGTQYGSLFYGGPSSSVDGGQVTLAAFWSNGSGLSGTPVTFTLGSQSCTGTTGSVTDGNGDSGASCTITLAQPVGTYTLEISSPGDASVYPASTSALFAITGPTSTGQCKDGGWKVFGIFKNQGDCVSYVATGGKALPSG